jgi:hypothetical protein
MEGENNSCSNGNRHTAGVNGYTSQQRRLMLFLPVDVTAMTMSILLPQLLQSFAEAFAPVRAATSVFDFPAIIGYLLSTK